MENLKDLVVTLANNDVDFVLAGGFGVVSVGGTFVTRDVDAVCRMDIDNLLRVFEALEKFHPVHRMTPQRLPFTREQIEKGDLKNLYLSSDLGQLDLLGEIKGIGGFEECLARSESINIDGVKIRILTLDALIASKRAMGRPRDLAAVLELEAIRERRKMPPQV